MHLEIKKAVGSAPWQSSEADSFSSQGLILVDLLAAYVVIQLNVGTPNLLDWYHTVHYNCLAVGRTERQAVFIQNFPSPHILFSVFRCKCYCELLPSAGCEVCLARVNCKFPFGNWLSRTSLIRYEKRRSAIPWGTRCFFRCEHGQLSSVCISAGGWAPPFSCA